MNLPSNPKDVKRLENAIKESDLQLCIVEAANAQIKSIFEALVEDEIEISKSMFNKLTRCYHEQNFNEVKERASDFEELYEGVMKKEQCHENSE